MSGGRPPAFAVSAGNFFFRHRNLLFPVVFAFLFIVSSPDNLFTESPLEEALEKAAVVLVLLGQAFRLAVIGFAYIKRGGKEGKVFAEKLVVRGFYAHTRNPMYVGNALIVLGFCILYESWFSYLVVLPFFLFAYYSIVVAEETYLSTRFGPEYDDYVKKVNRFIPDFRGLKASLSEFRYDWKRALRKDYGNITVAVAMLLVVGLRKSIGSASEFPSTRANAFFLGLALTVLFYSLVRYLKKTGRLASPNG